MTLLKNALDRNMRMTWLLKKAKEMWCYTDKIILYSKKELTISFSLCMYVCVCVCVCVCIYIYIYTYIYKSTHGRISNSNTLRGWIKILHRQQPTRLLHPWDSPGKNTGVGIYTLLYIKQITNKNLLSRYSTEDSTQYSVMSYMGKESKKEWIYV